MYSDLAPSISSRTGLAPIEEVKQAPPGNDLVRVLLYSNGGICNKFFNGIAPTNLYRENTSRMMIERYIRHICRFNVYLDAIVEKLEVPTLKGSTMSEASLHGMQNQSINNENSILKQGNQTVLRMISCRLKPL